MARLAQIKERALLVACPVLLLDLLHAGPHCLQSIDKLLVNGKSLFFRLHLASELRIQLFLVIFKALDALPQVFDALL